MSDQQYSYSIHPSMLPNSEDAATAISQLFNISEVQSAEFVTQASPSFPHGLIDIVGAPQNHVSPRVDMYESSVVDQSSNENQICYDFTKGRCGRGDKCKYSHDIATIVKFNSREQGICFDFLRGQCDRGLLCKFSHEMNSIAKLYQQAAEGQVGNANSTSICYNFLKGVCHKGNSCRYSHDLRVVMCTSSRPSNVGAASVQAGGLTTGASLSAGDATLALLQLLQNNKDAGAVSSSPVPPPPQSSPFHSRPDVPRLPFTPELQYGAKDSLQSPTDVLAYALSQNTPRTLPQQQYAGGIDMNLANVLDRSLSAGLGLDSLIEQLQSLKALSARSHTHTQPQVTNNMFNMQQLPRTTSGSVRPNYDGQDVRRVNNSELGHNSVGGSATHRAVSMTLPNTANIWSVYNNGNL
eukprot:TRINITY_DN3969_c0_g1_i2.p1 TRINITY_DN3969_c0_g1~~TRINITY_DN3969_c0_g1_i2.p1  ORF type:complete len:410 (+),score=60.88 TRINITY_DN3969_c0_g1_i2:141-1370(+)